MDTLSTGKIARGFDRSVLEGLFTRARKGLQRVERGDLTLEFS